MLHDLALYSKNLILVKKYKFTKTNIDFRSENEHQVAWQCLACGSYRQIVIVELEYFDVQRQISGQCF